MLRISGLLISGLLPLLLFDSCSTQPVKDIDCSMFPYAVQQSDSSPPEESVMIDTDLAEKLLVQKEYPKYPELAARAGLEGDVWVRLWIDRSGFVRQATITKSDMEIFNEVALGAARKLVFMPVACDGHPISVWATIPIRFRLLN